MHPLTIIIIAASAGFVLMDLVLNVKILFSCRRQIKWLKESNELLTQKNLELGISCTDRARELRQLSKELAEAKIQLDEATVTLAAKDRVYTELMRRFTMTNEALKRTTGFMNDKTLELRKTKEKLKSAHYHISVLRAEIVKLNRQLNQTKRRG